MSWAGSAKRFAHLGVSLFALALAQLNLAVGALAHGDEQHKTEPPVILAPGYSDLTFNAPEAGSYTLPVLGEAGGGTVLTESGNRIDLASLLGAKPVLLSFVYTSCDDVNGCPLASYVMGQVAKRVAADAALQGQVRFLSLSFDPAYDTPPVMAAYAENFKPDNSDWQFLTCPNEQSLKPILKRYNQSVVLEPSSPDGAPSARYSHILRVYLIDTERKFRNIYSVSFLHADTIINDLKTILDEKKTDTENEFHRVKNRLHGAGDVKHGYERSDYVTQSEHLPNRTGEVQNLLSLALNTPLGLPPLPQPADNTLNAAKISLGRKLFFDRRLSLNQTISCAMCHVPEQGFAHNELATAVGVEGRTVRRNAPTIYNIGYLKQLFHDARDDRLEHQIWQPLLATNEMANPSVSAVINKLRSLSDYAGLFEAAFDGEAANIENLGKAFASYERALVSANSPSIDGNMAKKRTP